MLHPPSMSLSIGRSHEKVSRPRVWVGVVLLSSLLMGGCPQEPEAPPEPPAERVESAGLEIAIAALPSFFRVASNEGEVLELVPADSQVAGKLVVGVETPEVGGVNLVAAIEAHKADIEGRTDGAFKGQRELGSQLGSAFYSRGHFNEAGVPMEETAIFVVHPDGMRMISLTYTYPQAEDSQARIEDQLFVVLSEIEPLATAADGAAADGAADAAEGAS